MSTTGDSAIARGDAVARYRAASEANDIGTLIGALSDDIEVVSPISGRMVFRGREDVRIVFAAVYSSLSGLRWRGEMGDDRVRTLIGDARIGPLALGDVTIVHLDDDGRIRRLSPHVRPWLALSAFALALAPRVARHPSLILRALRG